MLVGRRGASRSHRCRGDWSSWETRRRADLATKGPANRACQELKVTDSVEDCRGVT